MFYSNTNLISKIFVIHIKMNSHNGGNEDPLINKIKLADIQDKKKRVIIMGDSELRKRYNKFPNNKITTTKYLR